MHPTSLTPGTPSGPVISGIIAVVLLLFPFVPQQAHAQCLQNVNMNTWSRQGDPNTGQWTVINGGAAVRQSRNDYPTFYVAPFDLINVEITGNIQVTGTDDDYIGFVFGYQDPLSTNYTTYDFWLLDWKQREQASYEIPMGLIGREGFYLSRVSGTIPNNQVFRYFWNHQTTTNLFEPVDSLLAIHTTAGRGWQTNTNYQFRLTYTSVRIEIRINNQVIFQRDGCFQPGRFGFYNFSQPGVIYSNFNYQLLADYTIDDSTVCIGDRVQFQAVNTSCSTVPSNITSWQWDFGDGNTSTQVNPSHVYNRAGTFPVTLRITDNNNCVDTKTRTVVVSAGPTVDAGPDVGICPGESKTIGNPATGSTPPYTYSWSPATGLSSTTEAQPSASPGATTTYTLTVTDGDGCINTDEVTVRLITLSPPAIDGPIQVCPNSVWTYASSMGAGVTHTWSINPPSAGTITNGQGTPSVDVEWGNPGAGELILDVDSAGCTATNIIRVRISDRIFVSINRRGDRDTLGYCPGQALILDGGEGFVSYQWSPGGEQTRSISARTPGTYTVTVEDAFGCQGMDTVEVIEFPSPTPVIEPAGPVFLCEGDTLLLSLPEPYVSYQWSTGESSDQLLVTTGGIYSVTVVDDNGCSGSAPPVTVTMVNKPEPFITGDTVACVGAEEEYSILIPSGGTYSWSIDETRGMITETGANAIKVRWTDTGRAFVAVAETDPVSQCAGTDTLWVEVTEGLTPGIAGDTVICAGESARLTATGGPFDSHEWLRDGVLIGGATGSEFVATDPGSYTVRVSAGSCSGESEPHVLTVVPLPAPTIQPTGPITLCPGDSVQLTLAGGYAAYDWSTGATTSSITVRQPGLYSVTVDSLGCAGTAEEVEVRFVAFPDTAISGPNTACLNARGEYDVPDNPDFTYAWTVTGGTLISGAGSSRVTVEWTDSTGGMLMLVMTHTASGCSLTLTQPIIIDRTLRPEIRLPGSPVICQGSAIVLRAGRGFLAYRWFRDGTALANQDADTLLVTRAGAYTVEVTDNGGCSGLSDRVTVSVSDPPDPVVIADGPTTICRGESVVLRTQNSYASYTWSTGATTPSITVSSSGSYTVEVTDVNGCTATSDPLEIVARPITPPVISGPASLCRSNSEAQEYSVIAETGMSYTWDAVGAASVTPVGANRVAIVWGSVDVGQVLVTKTEDGVGCTAFDTLTVVIGDSLSPVITADGQPPAQRAVRLCAGEDVTLGVEGQYRVYRWSTGATTPTITVNQPGSYTVAVSDTTGCRGTSAPVSLTVAPAPAPVVTADGPLQFCRGDSVTLSTTNPYASYLWSTGATTRAIVVRDAGTYTVTVTSNDGCEGTSAATEVIVTPPAAHQVDGPASVCLDEEAVYRDAAADPNITYTWEVTGPVSGPGTIVSGQGTSEIRVRWPSAGQGTVRMIIDDRQSGCTGAATLIVSVGSGLTPVITPSADPVLCAGATLELCADAGDSYLWSPGGETTRCITVTAPGSYEVAVTRGSCSGSSGPFVVDPAPTPAAPAVTASQERLCLGGSTVLDAGPGYRSYTWLLDGQPTGDTSRALTFTPARGGSYRFAVLVRNAAGCEATSQVKIIEVFPPVTPVLSESGPEIVCDPAGTTYRYQWYINDTLVTGANTDRIPIDRTGVYVVQITDENGCSAWSDPLPVLARIPATTLGFACPAPRLFRIGETVVLPLALESAENLDDMSARELAVRLRYNPSVLSPGIPPLDARSENGERVITLTADRPAATTAGILLEIPFTVLFGNADCATVRIDSLWWTDGSARVTAAETDCEVCVEVCREGGTRLYYTEGALGLAQNRPNPFNSTTVIEYEVIERGPTSLYVLDVVGRRVATLLDETVEPGRYVTTFTADDLKSGTYICVLQTPSHSVYTLMMLVK